MIGFEASLYDAAETVARDAGQELVIGAATSKSQRNVGVSATNDSLKLPHGFARLNQVDKGFANHKNHVPSLSRLGVVKFFASGLLFDNDGVLVDSHAAAKSAWDAWAIEFSPGYDLDKANNAGRRAEDMVRELVAAEIFAAANDRINALEQSSAHLTVPLGGAVELLTGLQAGAAASFWTICTSANANLGRARLLAAGLPVPAGLVTGDDVERGKPHPDPYLLGAARLGLAPADCVVFEDAIAGVEAAAAAGVGLIVGVSERALATAADIVVRDLTGITFDGEELLILDSNRLR